MQKKSLLRQMEDKLPKRYKTVALINTALLTVLSVGVLTLAVQNFVLRANIRQMAYDQREMDITVKLLEIEIGKLKKTQEDLEGQVIALLDLVKEVQQTYEIVQHRRPDLSWERAWEKAQKLTYGARKYDLPLDLVIVTAWAESDFHWDARGPCGEKSMMQVTYSTFRGMRPGGDWNDLEQVFDAGLHYLRVCYQKQQQRAPDDPLVVFAYYNAGGSWTPLTAKQKAHKHVSRVQTVFRRMERLGARG